MARPRLAIGAALLLTMMSAGVAAACSCVRFADAREQFERTEVLFEGRVISRKVVVAQPYGASVVTRFKVSRVFKGRRSPVIDIAHSEATGGGCGIRFQTGKTYLVAAHSNRGRLSTNSCAAPRFPVSDFERIAGRGVRP